MLLRFKQKNRQTIIPYAIVHELIFQIEYSDCWDLVEVPGGSDWHVRREFIFVSDGQNDLAMHRRTVQLHFFDNMVF